MGMSRVGLEADAFAGDSEREKMSLNLCGSSLFFVLYRQQTQETSNSIEKYVYAQYTVQDDYWSNIHEVIDPLSVPNNEIVTGVLWSAVVQSASLCDRAPPNVFAPLQIKLEEPG
jgi:hypothetical protein